MKSDLDLKTYERTIYERIDLLIRHFHAVSDKLVDEEDVKSSIIDKFIDILGWDLGDPLEVKKEQKTEGRKKADYALKVEGGPKIYIEAKSLSKDLERGFDKTSGEGKRTYVEQTINYAYNSGVSWALLTNGKRWILFNAYWKGTNKDRVAFDLEIDDFLKDNNFDKIKLLAKEYVVTGKLDEYFKDRPFRNPVDEEVVTFLLECRRALTESVIKNNEGKYTTDQLREGIHRILDRLVFYKICEDRDILDYNRVKKTFDIFREDKSSQSFVIGLKSYYDWFNRIYDGEMFGPHFCEDFIVDNSVYEMMVDGLYQYDFATIGADILGRIYENYLGNTLQELEKGLKWVIDSKERKRFGQYYTPQYVVNYIIDNVGITRNSKILDPACGSGAFLIKAYDKLKLLNQEHIKRITQRKKHNLSEEDFKKWREEELPKIEEESINQILARNIHGVDLNPESVELTKVNLWLRSIQKDTPLNKLENNIACGNSLISGTEDELKQYFGDDWDRKRPFDWEKKFLDVFEKGGFDVVIGNPPYFNIQTIKDEREKEWLKESFRRTFSAESDIHYFFYNRGIELLKPHGVLGYISSRYFLEGTYAEPLRSFIQTNTKIRLILDFGSIVQVFPNVGINTTILILERCEDPEEIQKNEIKIVRVTKWDEELSTLISHISKNIKEKNYFDDWVSIFTVSQSELESKFWILNPVATINLSQKVKEKGKSIEKICDVLTGVETGLDTIGKRHLRIAKEIGLPYDLTPNLGEEVLKISKRTIIEKNLERVLCLPLIKNQDVRRYHLNFRELYLIFIPNEIDIDIYPNIKRHLEAYKPILEKRHYIRDAPWYALRYIGGIRQMLSKKDRLVTPYISPENRFTFIDGKEKYVYSRDITYITPRDDCPVNLKYILGILNSKLMEYVHKHSAKAVDGKATTSKGVMGRRYSYQPTFVSNYSILIPSNKREEQKHDQLVALIDKMLSLNKELQNINTNFFDYVDLRPKLKDSNLGFYFNQLNMNDKRVLNNANGIKGKIKRVKAREEGEWLIVSVDYEDENKKSVEDFDVLKCRFENRNFTKFIEHCILNYGKGIGKGNILDRVLKMENIPIFDNKSDVKNQQIIDEIMDSFLLAVEWKEKIESEIEETDRTIDQMVYELYGLTEEEIKIVEAST